MNVRRFVWALGPLVVLLYASGARAKEHNFARESEHYRIEPLELPDGVALEVGGMDFDPTGRLFVATRRGEIWSMNPRTPARDARKRWQLFASGLHEPLGLLATGRGEVVVAQRPEVTRIRDGNGDGRADKFLTMTQAWGLTGNYHEYAFGPVKDAQGNLYGTLNVAWESTGVSKAPYRGWAFKLTPDGSFIPFASGFRSPAGIGISPEGDIFVTDNQGDWVATSPLHHVEQDVFHGHPAGLPWTKGYKGPTDIQDFEPAALEPLRRPPAAWFVYGPAGHSPSQPVFVPRNDKFGPFAGQMLVGDQTKSLLVRVALEKVDGVFQGAVIPFLHGFASGITRMVFGPDGALYVGGTDRGWGAIGGKPFALERVAFTGKVPFEILSIAVMRDGFVVRFTQPLDPDVLPSAAKIGVTHHHYKYWSQYGSPHVETTAVVPKAVEVVEDGTALRVRLGPPVAGRVYTLRLEAMRSSAGASLLNPVAFYTLNRIPAIDRPVVHGGRVGSP
jgi:hypothetical protein